MIDYKSHINIIEKFAKNKDIIISAAAITGSFILGGNYSDIDFIVIANVKRRGQSTVIFKGIKYDIYLLPESLLEKVIVNDFLFKKGRIIYSLLNSSILFDKTYNLSSIIIQLPQLLNTYKPCNYYEIGNLSNSISSLSKKIKSIQNRTKLNHIIHLYKSALLHLIIKLDTRVSFTPYHQLKYVQSRYSTIYEMLLNDKTTNEYAQQFNIIDHFKLIYKQNHQELIPENDSIESSKIKLNKTSQFIVQNDTHIICYEKVDTFSEGSYDLIIYNDSSSDSDLIKLSLLAAIYTDISGIMKSISDLNMIILPCRTNRQYILNIFYYLIMQCILSNMNVKMGLQAICRMINSRVLIKYKSLFKINQYKNKLHEYHAQAGENISKIILNPFNSNDSNKLDQIIKSINKSINVDRVNYIPKFLAIIHTIDCIFQFCNLNSSEEQYLLVKLKDSLSAQ